MELGQLVRAARELRGLDQERLATQVGVSRVQISRLESGSRGASPATLLKIAQALDIDALELLEAAARRGATTDDPPADEAA